MKKVNKVITFNQEAWLKSYIDMNTQLRENAKNNFGKNFSSWGIKILKIYLQCKWKLQILSNKSVHLGFSVLEISKIAMHELWYDYVKSKYNEKEKLCYVGTDSLTVQVKTWYLWTHRKRYWKKVWYLVATKRKNTKVNYGRIRSKNHERICGTKSSTCSYLTDDSDESKKAKGTKRIWNQKKT